MGKFLCGSGFEEVVVESGICAGGSIDKVMAGKDYNRALRGYMLIYEALEMLLFSVFESSIDTEQILSSEAKDMLKTLIENPNQQNLEAIVNNDSYKEIYAEDKMFEQNV